MIINILNMDYNRSDILHKLNKLYSTLDWDYFDTLSPKDKCLIIKEMFYNNSAKDKESNIKLSILLINNYCEIIRTSEWGVINIPNFFINLLCIILARTHDINNLKYIIKAKQSRDLFFYVDSNLIFEFSPNGNRETCIQGTKKYVQKLMNGSNDKEWYKTFCDWVTHYSQHYDESLVQKYWQKYKTKQFKDLIYSNLEFL